MRDRSGTGCGDLKEITKSEAVFLKNETLRKEIELHQLKINKLRRSFVDDL